MNIKKNTIAQMSVGEMIALMEESAAFKRWIAKKYNGKLFNQKEAAKIAQKHGFPMVAKSIETCFEN